MKITELVPEFSEIRDTRWVVCPFIKDFEVEIARIGNEGWKSWAREAVKENAYLQKLSNAAGAVSAAAAGGQDLAERVALKVDMGDSLLDAVAGEKEREGVARYLMRNWRGAAVSEEFTPEGAIELMGSDLFLGVDVELVADSDKEGDNLAILGTTLIGQAIALWVKWEAQQQERFREGWIEGQAKNSETLFASNTG
jgi:hypothetical protein